MKVTRIGWIGRTQRPQITGDGGPCLWIDTQCGHMIQKARGGKGAWHDIDWPPVKVRITVETIAPKGRKARGK